MKVRDHSPATTPAATGPSIQAIVPWKNRVRMMATTFGARACGMKRRAMLEESETIGQGAEDKKRE
jgi:hypothetical protein